MGTSANLDGAHLCAPEETIDNSRLQFVDAAALDEQAQQTSRSTRQRTRSRSHIHTTMHNNHRTRLAVTAAVAALALALLAPHMAVANDNANSKQAEAAAAVRSTQPTLDRQLDSPPSSSGSSSAQQVPVSSSPSAPTGKSVEQPAAAAAAAAPQPTAVSAATPAASPAAAAVATPRQAKPVKTSSQKKALAAIANAQQNYDRYQLKATVSNMSSGVTNAPAAAAAKATSDGDKKSAKPDADSNSKEQSDKQTTAAWTSNAGTSKKSIATGHTQSSSSYFTNYGRQKAAAANSQTGASASTAASSSTGAGSSSLSLFRRILPSFMGAAAAASAAVSSAAAASNSDKHAASHSRSAHATSASGAGDALLAKASHKIAHLLTSSAKKSASASLAAASSGSGGAGIGAVPDHAPFFVRKSAIDRQGGFALSNLLSNPLGLGLLFSAPFLPSLLLTPLAIAGLSPAMSAINNFFGDDDEPAAASTPATPTGPLAMLASGSSPFASILQSASANSPALAAMQSILGTPSSTERPLFNPGMFANQGIANAIGNVASSSSSSSSSGASSTGASSSAQPARGGLFGGSGGLMQAAASMISPSFAAPPSSSSSGSNSGLAQASGGASAALSAADNDDGLGFMQVATDVFEKVSNYISATDKDSGVAQASGGAQGSSPAAAQASPLSTLVGLSNFSPLQLSSLFASSPFAAAVSPAASAAGGSGGVPAAPQKAGLLTTLKNAYEMLSSSFLRRQETDSSANSNECQQRLICELHQRAMNSKLFKRSLHANIVELVKLDKSIQEQMQHNPQMQARVDADTKAMLNDFLKATSSFKNGRSDLVNCGKMFPKCSRVMLLSAANAHLVDSGNGKALGKFANLMKKMKFKSMQQHQSQWKLRKSPQKSAAQPQQFKPLAGSASGAFNAQPMSMSASAPIGSIMSVGSAAYTPTDYMQVAPLASSAQQQMSPADSLKIAQQIMLMSQQYQQQFPQQQQQQQQQQALLDPQQYSSSWTTQQQQQPSASFGQNVYTDAQPSAAMYSDATGVTEMPYFLMSQQQQQQPQQQQQSQPQQQNYGQMSSSSLSMSGPIDMQSQQQQQQQQPLQQQQQQTMQQPQQQPQQASYSQTAPSYHSIRTDTVMAGDAEKPRQSTQTSGALIAPAA